MRKTAGFSRDIKISCNFLFERVGADFQISHKIQMRTVLTVFRDIFGHGQVIFDLLQVESIEQCPVMQDEFFGAFLGVAGNFLVVPGQGDVGQRAACGIDAQVFKRGDDVPEDKLVRPAQILDLRALLG